MRKGILLIPFVLLIILGLCVFAYAQTATDKKTETKKVEGKKVDKKPIAVIETNMGVIELELWPDVAPKTVENFIGLIKKGSYNDCPFHRIIAGFMLQGGDYTNKNGTGGQSIWGKEFEDEVRPDVKFDKPGLLAMANRGPATNGSQFFITFKNTDWLNGKHTIFGQVVKGMDVVSAIEKVGSPDGKPTKEVKIVKATVK